MNDNRMQWIRNFESLDLNNTNSYYIEYEIASECRIAGILNYKNGKILCRFGTTTKTAEGLFHYFLRIQYARVEVYNKQADPKGYYCKGGVLEELLSLFSLYFQCRFYLIATYQEFGEDGLKVKIPNEFLRRQYSQGMYPKVFQGNKNFAMGLSDFLDSIKLLNNKLHQQFILACNNYANALKEIGIDEEMVFIRLVSAIECLSKDFKLRGKDNSSRKFQKKFLKFTEKHSKGFLKGGNWKAKHCKIMRKDFPNSLKAIYDARSRYLHDGEPMYLSHVMAVCSKWDTDPSCGMTSDNRAIPKSKKLPYAYWFENLVRYCLLDFLNVNKK